MRGNAVSSVASTLVIACCLNPSADRRANQPIVVTAIAQAVEVQGQATAEISRNVQQTAASTQDVTANIAGVNQAASATGAAASEVLGASDGLSRQAEELATEVNSFVAGVRAA